MSPTYLIVDRARDVALFRRLGLLDKQTVLTTISAEAFAGIPIDWPADRLLHLDRIISQAEIETSIAGASVQLIERYFADPSCPYYKVKQVIDVCLEKGAIVDALDHLPGHKFFIGQRGAWATVDADLPEDLRIPALLMASRDGFQTISTEKMPRLGFEARALARNLVKGLRSLSKEAETPGPILVDASYGSASDFAAVPTCPAHMGALFASCLKRLRFAEAWSLLCFDQPVAVEPQRSAIELASTLAEHILQRSRRIHAITLDVARRENWRSAPYLFTVKHGGIIDYAAVRAARSLGVPVVTMQHAVVGHDEWTASQYVDAFESDLKLVASQTVALELPQFECGRCEYLATSIPHFRPRAGHLEDWPDDSLTYVLTGFTRTNTMYDQRRLNDAIYLSAVRQNVAVLASHFQIRLKPHPYNVINFGMAIEQRICAEFGVKMENADLKEFDGAVVIDSPTTILGDAVRLGRWVFVINETAVLREPFASRAAELGVLHESAAALARTLLTTDRQKLRAGQAAFREFFLSTYLTAEERTLPEAISAWLGRRDASLPRLSDAGALQRRIAHPRGRGARASRT